MTRPCPSASMERRRNLKPAMLPARLPSTKMTLAKFVPSFGWAAKSSPRSQCRIWFVVGGGGGGFRVMCRLCFPLGRNILWDVRELKNKSLKFEFVGCYPPEEQVSVGLPIPNLHPSPLFVSCPPANDCFVSSLPLHRSSQSRVNNHLLSSTHGHGRLISAKFPPRWLDTPCVVDFAASQENLLGRLVLLECPT